MQEVDKIKGYINSVCEQIRWKKAHEVIGEELENHIIDQKTAFLSQGIDEETATNKAIAEMGDPVLVGTQLDRTHRPKPEWSIIILTLIIITLGIAIRLLVINDISNDTNASQDLKYKLIYLFKGRLIATAIGVVLMIVAYFMDYTIFGKYPITIFSLVTVAAIVSLMKSTSFNITYSAGSIIFFLLPISFAGIIYKLRNKGYIGIAICVVISVAIGKMARISDLFIFAVACFILMTIAIVKDWFCINKWIGCLCFYLPVIFTFIVRYSKLRDCQIIFDKRSSPSMTNVLEAFIRDVIPNAKLIGHSDVFINDFTSRALLFPQFSVSYLINNYGWIPFILVMVILMAFIVRLFVLCKNQKCILGKLVATAVTITFTTQVIIYLVANFGFNIFPQLYFHAFASMGTSTAINMFLVGIMLSVFRTDGLVKDKKLASSKSKLRLFEKVDGKLSFNLARK